MKSLIYRSIMTVAVALVCCGVARAVPARPGLVAMRQPDGTEIKVRIVGDEYFHYYLSEDGYLLVNDGDRLYYAGVDDRDSIMRSAIVAGPAVSRPAEAKVYLRTVDMSRVAAALQRRSAAVRSARLHGLSSRPSSVRRSLQRSVGLFDTGFPSMGDQKGLVVLVEYQDVKFTLDNPHDYFSRMLNEDGFSDYGGTGCAAEYFRESSMGRFRPQFDVYGPITLSQSMSYYGGNSSSGGTDRNPQKMAVEACRQLDATVDFSEYDRDGDGIIDNVFIFYAGRGEATGGGANTVWPHSWYVTAAERFPYTFDGVLLDRYACSNEWIDERPDGVGTFIHEFSHVMGLPDLYATDYSDAFTPGGWSVLDYGSYNNSGHTPPLYSVYERYALGWMEPRVIDGPATVRLKTVDTNQGCIIPTSSANEFFLLENRQQTGWDKYIPGHGMLVWHVDYNSSVWNANTVNNSATHQYVDIEEADNTQTEDSRDGDAFPGTAGVTSFTDDTGPSMRTWSGQGLGLPITDITEQSGSVIFNVAGGLPLSGSVTALDATDITPESFTAHWLPVDGAVSYELSVYSLIEGAEKPQPLPGYDRLDVDDVTTFVVTGLTPATEYRYVVFPVGDSGAGEASNAIAVTTGAPTLRYLTPMALDATDVTMDGFVAHWQSVDGATSYRLDVIARIRDEPSTVVVDFTGGVDAIPEGWTSTSTLTYANAAYSGEAVPSLRFAFQGSSITSPVFGGDITSLSFWHRGVNTPEANHIVVSASADGTEWADVATYGVTNDAGGIVISVGSLPVGTHAVRISYDMPNAGSLAIDDIKVEREGDITDRLVGSFDAGNSLSMAVTGLTAGTTYFYTVTAIDGEEVSRPSNEITVVTSGAGSSVSTATVSAPLSLCGRMLTVGPCGHVCVTDVSGRTVFRASGLSRATAVALPSAGVYVVVVDGRAAKLLVR